MARSKEGKPTPVADLAAATGGAFSIGIRRQHRGDISTITLTPFTGRFASRRKRGARLVPAFGLSVGKAF
jgi:hypothetical protein